MRHAMDLCDVAAFTVPMEKLSWMRPQYRHSVFIPVGANLPVSREAASRKTIARRGKLKIAVFSVTGGSATQKEIGEIVGAVRFASSHVGNLQLTVLGRNSKETESEFLKQDRKSTRLNSSHGYISYAVFCLEKKNVYYFLQLLL